MWKELSICILFLWMAYLSAYTQELTDEEKTQIVRRGQLKIQDFELLLQNISNQAINRGARERYIISSYSREDTLFNQVFYNEDVIIEDDLSPIELTSEQVEVSGLKVSTYLNNFKIYYEQSYKNSVFFSDPTFSEVQKGDFIYVIASYTSEFKGRHKTHENYQYKPVRRKATLRAEYDYENDRWQVWIAGVNYDRDHTQEQEEELPIQDTPVISATPQNEEVRDTLATVVQTDNIRVKGRSDTVAQVEKEGIKLMVVEESPLKSQITPVYTETIAEDSLQNIFNKVEEEERQENQAQVEQEKPLAPLEFTIRPPSEIKRGKNIALQWNYSVTDATLMLYRGDHQVHNLRQGLYGDQWNWSVKQKPGKEYSLVLYDPATNRRVRSGQFRVKSRFPMVLKVGITASVGYLVYAYFDKLPPFKEKDGTKTSLKIDIEPEVPPSK